MICEHCLHFQGLLSECRLMHEVNNGLEATDCDDYLYNGGCNCG